MPLTWFAHQSPVVPLKMARPAWFDATALCVGSMMPDVLYAFNGYFGKFATHHWVPAIAWGLPMTVIIATLTRHVLAPGGAPQLPDLGAFRIHSYGVLARRRPHPLITLTSAAIGIASHVVFDSFTHVDRWTVRHLGYNDVYVEIAGQARPLSRVFQYIGHSLGSVVCVLFLLGIGRRRLLEAWYGEEAVAAARAITPSRRDRLRWRAAVAAGFLIGVAWGRGEHYMEVLQRMFLALFAGGVAGSLIVSGSRRSPAPRPRR